MSLLKYFFSFAGTLQMVKKAPVSKAAQASKIQKTSSKEKKKWSKGKVKENATRSVAVDQKILQRIEKEMLDHKVLTKTMIAEKYNLNAGVAERLLRFFCENGMIRRIGGGSMVKVYSRIAEEKIETVDIVSGNVPGAVNEGVANNDEWA